MRKLVARHDGGARRKATGRAPLTAVFGFCFAAAIGWTGVLAQDAKQAVPYGPIPIPDLSGLWQHTPIVEYEALPFKPSPIGDLYRPLNQQYLLTVFHGDYRNPILQPWAAAEVKRHADAVTAGNQIPSPQERCEMSGVPNIITLPAALQILQTPTQVTLIYQRDHQIRRVAMNVPHSASPPPSWYGESVGHYDGDTLVIDTIGMNDKTPVDIFGTPHTEALHVVERFRPINAGKQIEVVFTVDDPKTFTTPWPGRFVYNRSNQQWFEEEICAENDRLAHTAYDIPTETKPVF